jgi:long-subunit fatty acid transport protein
LNTAGLAFGAGARLAEMLAVGVSATLSVASAANAPVYVPSLADLDTLLVDSDVSVSTHVAPHFGLVLTPIEALKLSATVHSPQGTTIETSFSYLIATGIEQSAGQRFEHGYLPWTFGLGADVTLDIYDIGLSTTYALWSNYKDRHAAEPSGRYAWSDMLDAALTLRARGDALSGFVSCTYEPTPVPSQDGRTNYVDSTRLGAALGGSYTLMITHGVPLAFALEAQLHRLVPRTTHKESDQVRDEVPDDAVGGTPRGPIEGREGLQTNNPGFPSFESSGWLAALAVRVSLAY